MSIAGIAPISAMAPMAPATSIGGVSSTSGTSFSKMLENAIGQVSNTSTQADSMAASYAAGGPVTIDQLMVAEQQASLALDTVVQVRDRVVSAYQSIMNMQV